MVAEKIVGLNHLDVGDLRRLQNLPRASAPVMFEVARTSPHFLKAWLTRHCAISPIINGIPTNNR